MNLGDRFRVSSAGLRTRRLRAALSGLGIAIGVAAIVGVLGLSASSQAGLLGEIDRLGTNLLTVSTGRDLTGADVALPVGAPARISHLRDVTGTVATGAVGEPVYRTPYVPEANTNSIALLAAGPSLPGALGTHLTHGRFLDAATASQPVVVLGSTAARRLGFDGVPPGARIWIGRQWFSLAGILAPAALAPGIDNAALIGFPAARDVLGFDGHPTTIYVRTGPGQVAAVRQLLGRAANPQDPSQVSVSRPSDALVARARAESALNALFLGLGAISLLVGTVGVANTMIVSVLERRSEIGLRRALGATRGHIRAQFLGEAVLLSTLGGLVGICLGVAATVLYAGGQGWLVVVPAVAWAGGLGATVVIGAVAGLVPALRAARLSPTEALWSL